MTYKILIHVFLFLILYPLLIIAQNSAPTINNVTFSQRTDGSYFVDIFYDVYDSDGDSLFISIKVSNDDGINWNFSCNNTTGDIGFNISNGTAKHIIWDFRAEHPDTCCDKFRIKIIANDSSCPGIPTITDPRNGEVYETVLIGGEQCWLKRNLNIGARIDGTYYMSDNGIIEKHCYDNNEGNCSTYGGLYQWDETMQYTTQEGTQGICPEGWHIPTRLEFIALRIAVEHDGEALKDLGQGVDGGEGTNTSGFSALLAGNYYYYSRNFKNLNNHAVFWSSYTWGGDTKWGFILLRTKSDLDKVASSKETGYSIRCLKD